MLDGVNFDKKNEKFTQESSFHALKRTAELVTKLSMSPRTQLVINMFAIAQINMANENIKTRNQLLLSHKQPRY